MSEYLDDVKRYDADASAEKVDRIVKHLGIALRSRDASLVSCSDPSELDRVREKWCNKKLGSTNDAGPGLLGNERGPEQEPRHFLLSGRKIHGQAQRSLIAGERSVVELLAQDREKLALHSGRVPVGARGNSHLAGGEV